MFEKSKCEQCLCNTCVYDYGYDVGSVYGSCLCKSCCGWGCYSRCIDKNTNEIYTECENYIQETKESTNE